MFIFSKLQMGLAHAKQNYETDFLKISNKSKYESLTKNLTNHS